MSSKDATKNKLLDSMRLSKGGVIETPAEATSAKKPATTKAAPKKAATKKKARKAAPKKTAARKPVRKSSQKAVSPGTHASKHSVDIAGDSFQSSGRVWPD